MFGWKNLKSFSLKSDAHDFAKVLENQGIESKITNDSDIEEATVSISNVVKLWVKEEDVPEALDVILQNEKAA